MVFFNYATMQMAAKIVYYGPGLCGKTTNLHYIYAKTSPQSRGEMVSLETETDRTLFFDLLPIDVGVIGGFKTRLQLYTIPGQVFYNTTRKLVLKGVDGLVFVADSQVPMLSANVDSLKNLRENLAEIGLNLDDIPMVLQFNKRDLPHIAPVGTLREMLDPEGKYEYVEASAVSGQGVFETLKMISKLTLRMLRRRMMGDEARAARKPVFQVHGEPAAPEVPRGSSAAPPSESPAAPITPHFVPSPPAPPSHPPASAAAAAPLIDRSDVAVGGVQIGATSAAVATAAEPEIDFGQIEAPEPPKLAEAKPVKPPAEPPMKHVRLRSTVDIMAELEALRKKATQTTPKGKKEVPTTPAATRRDAAQTVQRSMAFSAGPGVAERTRAVRVTVTMEDEQQNVVQKQEQRVEIDETSDFSSLNVDLRVDFKPGQVN